MYISTSGCCWVLKRCSALLAQFRLQSLDERNQYLRLYLGLLYGGDAHASLLWNVC
jgi:hypothetical protein